MVRVRVTAASNSTVAEVYALPVKFPPVYCVLRAFQLPTFSAVRNEQKSGKLIAADRVCIIWHYERPHECAMV